MFPETDPRHMFSIVHDLPVTFWVKEKEHLHQYEGTVKREESGLRLQVERGATLKTLRYIDMLYNSNFTSLSLVTKSGYKAAVDSVSKKSTEREQFRIQRLGLGQTFSRLLRTHDMSVFHEDTRFNLSLNDISSYPDTIEDLKDGRIEEDDWNLFRVDIDIQRLPTGTPGSFSTPFDVNAFGKLQYGEYSERSWLDNVAPRCPGGGNHIVYVEQDNVEQNNKTKNEYVVNYHDGFPCVTNVRLMRRNMNVTPNSEDAQYSILYGKVAPSEDVDVNGGAQTTLVSTAWDMLVGGNSAAPGETTDSTDETKKGK
tara:strand:- start:315 stop:1250 length:936 start_codon:yes stop_codon:yes gene_type:complete